jgi:hypothetical protein
VVIYRCDSSELLHINHFPLPLHTYQSQSLGTSGLVTPSFSTSTTTDGVMKHGLVIMRVTATEMMIDVELEMIDVEFNTLVMCCSSMRMMMRSYG